MTGRRNAIAESVPRPMDFVGECVRRKTRAQSNCASLPPIFTSLFDMARTPPEIYRGEWKHTHDWDAGDPRRKQKVIHPVMLLETATDLSIRIVLANRIIRTVRKQSLEPVT